MSLDPRELLGLLPRPALKGRARVRTVEGEERVRRVRKAPQVKASREAKRAAELRYIAKHGERVLQMRRTAAKRYYWRDVEKSREYHRKRMTGKQRKENYTPDEWQRRLAMHKAAKLAREAADPTIREKRLAKGRAYWQANKHKRQR